MPTWAPNLVTFLSTTARGLLIAGRQYKGADIPKAGGEHTRINLWLAGGAAPTDGNEVEVVLSGFSFTRR
jgi:hypothetical protein